MNTNDTDPNEGILEVERSLAAHFIGQVPDDCDKAVVYVMQRDGLWERRRNSLGIFTHCVGPAHVPGLPVVLRQGFELTIPRIPTSILWEAISFFREVYFQMGTESVIRVIYDANTGLYRTDCPPQIVTRASVNFDRKRLPQHQIVVADIHSHGGMKAGFSSIDDADEVADRFYGVIGDLGSALPQMSFRLAIGGTHMRIPLGSLFNLDEDPVFSCTFPEEWMDRVTKAERRRQRRATQLDLSGVFEHPEEEEWPNRDAEDLEDLTHLWFPPSDEDEVL